jgi:hypothetical protein
MENSHHFWQTECLTIATLVKKVGGYAVRRKKQSGRYIFQNQQLRSYFDFTF